MNDSFVGYVSFETEKNNENSYLINDIHIVAKHQKKGLGTQILNFVIDAAIKENKTQLKVFIFEKNSSIKFYEKNGFKKVEHLEKSNSCVMIKKISINYLNMLCRYRGMIKFNKLLGFILISALLLIAACSSDDNKSDNSVANTDTSDSVKSTNTVKPTGGEKLISVRAEYSFSYDNGAYDPTLRYTYIEDITYKECKEWQSKENGASNTHFYATFSGGEPTKVGRTANEYYMIIKYGNNQELKTDKRAVFKDIPSEFYEFVDTGCYPNATIEIYNTNDELMGRKSFDYTID